MAKILFIDDDVETLQLYKEALVEAGHTVTGATDGIRALALLDRHSFDFVITDLVMPYLDGERVARLAKHRFPEENFRIILLSAAAVELGSYKNAHVDTYVAKGEPASTLAILREAIENVGTGPRVRSPQNIHPRRITKELLEAEEQFALVLQQMSQGVMRLTPEATVASANRPALNHLSVAEEDLLGRPLWDAVGEPAGSQLLALFTPPLAEGERRRGTIAVDGGRAFLRAELLPAPGKAEELLFLFLTDVTAEHAVSEYLDHSGQSYRTIVESTNDLLWTVDTYNNLTYISPGTLRFTGYTPEEYHREGLRLLLGATEREAQEILAEAQENCSRGVSYQFEKKLPVKQDGRAWSLIRVNPLLDNDGSYRGVVFVATDIDWRKRAEDQLRRAVEEREALIREIHHRVKNSVQIIVSMIRLRLGGHPSTEVQGIAEGLENRIRVIAGVYAQLYDYKSLDRVDGATLIRHSANLALDHMPTFEVRQEGDAFELTLDAAIPIGLLVREFVRNVGFHVYPYADSARLEIRWIIDGPVCEISFTDNGPGFEPSLLEAPESLGFLIVQSCAAQLQGELTYDSPDAGGTRITLRCPHKPPSALEEIDTV
ncbi:MAG: PAS domain S-box protein [Alkalispirochaeta sp.]